MLNFVSMETFPSLFDGVLHLLLQDVRGSIALIDPQ